MKLNPNQQIELTINKHRFLTRDEQKSFGYNHNEWETINIQEKEMEKYIREGCAYTPAIFRCPENPNNQRLLEYFQYSHGVVMDIDYGRVSLEVFLNTLQYKPTIAYTTVSDQLTPGNFRYRLLYLFDEPINNDNEYWILYRQIAAFNHIDLDCKNAITDASAEVGNQFYFGNASMLCFYTSSHIIYNPEDFKLDYCKRLGMKRPTSQKQKRETCRELEFWFSKTTKPYNALSRKIKDDIRNKPYRELVEYYKYQKGHRFIFQEKLNFDEKGRARRPEDYIEVYYPPIYTKEEGNVVMIPFKRGNGFKRRRSLFYDAVRIRLIRPEMWAETLVYNVLRTMLRYIEWDDENDPITPEQFIDIVQRAMSVDITKPEVRQFLKSERSGKCTADKEYCRAKGLRAASVAQSLYTDEKYDWIESWYNPLISVGQNFLLQPNEKNQYYSGKVCLSTLRNFCKQRGYATNPKPKVEDIFQEGMSAKICYEYIENYGFPISMATVYNFYKKTKVDTKTGLKIESVD